jgi:hypothetical protein
MKEALVSIVFLGIVGGFIWFGADWSEKKKEQADSRPSIGALSSAPAAQKNEEPKAEVSASQPPEDKPEQGASAKPAEDPAKLAVKVLNGGAAKGSAAKVQALLKQGGYAQAQAGNTVGDYAGTTVYYLEGFKESAEQVKQVLAKDYPNVQTKQASSNKSEEGGASVVVIMGK